MFKHATTGSIAVPAMVFAIILIFVTARAASATNYTYTGLAATCPFPPGECGNFVPGDASNWGDTRNWSPHGVPSGADTATIGNFTVNINGVRQISGLTLTGGSLGSGTLALAGSSGTFISSWTGGAISGTINIAGGAALLISGDNNRFLSGATFNNNGTVTWAGAGAILCENGTVFNNKAGGIFNAQNKAGFNFFSTPQSTFNNQAGATFNKSGVGTITTFTTLFSNAGTVNGNSGLLELNGGGTSGGTFTARNGARVNVSGILTGTFNPAAGGILGIQQQSAPTTNLGTGAKFLGAGITKIFEGIVKVTGTVTTGEASGPGILEMENGTLIGSSSSSLASSGGGFFRWTGGVISAENSLLNIAASGQFQISGANNRFLSSGTVNNSGTVTWTGTGAVLCENGALFANKAGGIFNAQNNSGFNFFSTPQSTFSNQAGSTFNKTGSGTATTFTTLFSNAGTVNGNSGLLELNGGGTSSGLFTAAAGGRTNVSGTLTATFNPAAGGIIGLQQQSASATLLANGVKFLGAGVTRVFEGTVKVTGSITTGQAGAPGILEIESGNFIGTASSNLSSAGSGLYRWTGGVVSAEGSILNITASGQFQISGADNRFLSSGTVNNSGTVTWTGTGAILCENGALFANKTGGIFNAQNNSGFNFFSTPQSTFSNQAGAVFNKTGAATTTTFNTLFSNAGTVNGNSGLLELNGGGTSSGTFTAASGGRTNVSGVLTATFNPAAGGIIGLQQQSAPATTLGTGTKFQGTGVTKVFEGIVTIINTVTAGQTGGPGTLQIESGTLAGTANGHLTTAGTGLVNWTGGIVAGIINIDGGCQFRISGDDNRFLSACTVNNSGVVTWQNTGAILCENNSVFNNKSGGAFNAQNNSGFLFFSAPVSIFNNLAGATFTKSGASSTTNFGIPFNNSGTGLVNAVSGTVAVAAGASTGIFRSAAGGHVDFAEPYTFNTGTTFRGTGCRTSSGQVKFNGTTLVESGGDFEITTAIGTASSNLTTAGTGVYKWTGGVIGAENSVLNIAAGSQFQITGADNRFLSSGTVNNSGIVTWTGAGAILCENGATFNNKSGGTFNAQNDSGFNFFSTPQSTFNNQAGGTFNKTGAATTTTFTTLFSNAGAVNLTSGTLGWNSDCTQTAGSTTLGGGSLTCTQLLLKGGTLRGTGPITGDIANSGGNVEPGLSPGRITQTGAYAQSATGKFAVDLNGLTAGTQHDQLKVTGTVALGGTLQTSVNFSPATGDAFVIIDNDGTDAVTSTFAGLANNATFVAGGQLLRLAYNGGDGNDVVLTRLAPPTLSISDATLTEGNIGTTSMTFTVTLSTAMSQAVTVDYQTANNTAISPADYAAASGTLTFAAGQTSKQFTVPIQGDTLDENDETFFVDLKNPTLAQIGDSRSTGTIIDNDSPPALSIADAPAVSEGSGGSTPANFAVALSTASGKTVTVNFATANGTATAPADFAAAGGTLTFAPGETTKTIAVQVAGDLRDEVTETFSVSLANPTNAAINDGVATGTIVDDDGPSILINNPSAITEGNSGSVNAVFTVMLSAASPQTVTVAFATADFTAEAGEDYQSKSGTLIFAPGQTSGTITVAITGDVLTEENEAFRVNLSNPVNAFIADGAAAAYIIDDDAAVARTLGRASTNGLAPTGSSASVSSQCVTLTFAGKVPAGAADANIWKVAVDAGPVAVEEVTVQGSTVTLLLPSDSLHAGDAVEVSWANAAEGLPGSAAGPFEAR